MGCAACARRSCNKHHILLFSFQQRTDPISSPHFPVIQPASFSIGITCSFSCPQRFICAILSCLLQSLLADCIVFVDLSLHYSSICHRPWFMDIEFVKWLVSFPRSGSSLLSPSLGIFRQSFARSLIFHSRFSGLELQVCRGSLRQYKVLARTLLMVHIDLKRVADMSAQSWA